MANFINRVKLLTMSIKIKIRVTKEILAKSKQCEMKSCAFAHAVRDILPDAAVFADRIIPFSSEHVPSSFDKRGPFCVKEEVLSASIPLLEYKQIGFGIPHDMKKFIRAFDDAKQISRMKEKEFELKIPDWVVDRINITEVTRILENHPTLTLIKDNEKEAVS